MNSDRAIALRQLIDQFLRDKLAAKLKKGADEKTVGEQFELKTWLTDAAKLSGQLKFATHVLKATHPDAKGTNILCSPKPQNLKGYVCTSSLAKVEPDVVGNAAAQAVCGLLNLTFENRKLFQLFAERDKDLLSILTDSGCATSEIVESFDQLTIDRSQKSSHTLAKQVYWLIGDDPTMDSQFHLLTPLYASSLAQHVYNHVEDKRFGQAAKEARQARRNQEYVATVIVEYPDMVVQKLGGSKPQNISKLNSSRRGTNYLFASLPPQWEQTNQPPRDKSIFSSYALHKHTRTEIEQFRLFLGSDPPKTIDTRIAVEKYCRSIAKAVQDVAVRYLTLEPGWSTTSNLDQDEQLWLDPLRAELNQAFAVAYEDKLWQADICKKFANWLQAKLQLDFALGDIENAFLTEVFDEEISSNFRPVLI